MLYQRFQEFLKLDTASGILLVAATLSALIFANVPFLAEFYRSYLATPVGIIFGSFEINKPLLLWINDGLMAIFFLLIGLEVKREFLVGDLSSPSQIVLPSVAAVGGMLVPALLYVWVNIDDPIGLDGWAIPTATDIAFALGVLTLLGDRVPASLKMFLMALAIIDDLGAIIVIALFYTSQLSLLSLILASACIATLITLNVRGVTSRGVYIFVGVIMWICVLKSGIHATLAGVVLAFTIPMKGKDKRDSPLLTMEHAIHPWVGFMILPVFAFANAGVGLSLADLGKLSEPVSQGVILGLIAGKQLGVFGFSFLVIKSGLAKMPEGATWMHIYGVSVLCGIGFTMSMFVGSLAFEHAGSAYLMSDRLAILLSSVFSAVFGYVVLRYFSKRADAPEGVKS